MTRTFNSPGTPPPAAPTESKWWKQGDHQGHLLALLGPFDLIEGYDGNGHWKEPSNVIIPNELHCVTCSKRYDDPVMTGAYLTRQLQFGPTGDLAGRIDKVAAEDSLPAWQLLNLTDADANEVQAYFAAADDDPFAP